MPYVKIGWRINHPGKHCKSRHAKYEKELVVNVRRKQAKIGPLRGTSERWATAIRGMSGNTVHLFVCQ